MYTNLAILYVHIIYTSLPILGVGIYLYYLHILYINEFTYIESGYFFILFAYIIYIQIYLY